MSEAPIQTVQRVGGDGPLHFKSSPSEEGNIVKEFTVWATETRIQGFQFRRTNEEPSVIFGNRDEGNVNCIRISKNFKFNPGECITQLSLWDNDYDRTLDADVEGGIAWTGKRLGWICLETNQQRVFDFGMHKRKKPEEVHKINVGSGILVGFEVRYSAEIDSLGFVFLESRPVTGVLTNVKYDRLSEEAGIVSVRLQSYRNVNCGTTQRNWAFSGSKTVTTSSSWACTSGLEEFVSKIIIDGYVPNLKTTHNSSVPSWHATRMSLGYAWETANITSASRLEWSYYGTLPPGKSISLEAKAYQGDICTPFTGTMEVQLENGKRFSYYTRGEYKGKIYSAVYIQDVP